ncbi:unnamed protein product [Boreogadus saida]
MQSGERQYRWVLRRRSYGRQGASSGAGATGGQVRPQEAELQEWARGDRDSTGRVTAALRLRHVLAATLPCLHFHRERYGSAAAAVFTRDHEIPR